MSKITLSTNILKEMTSKAMKGVTNHKLLCITQLLGIKSEKGILSVSAVDKAGNYIRVRETKTRTGADDFAVAAQADLFHKLISKINTDKVELVVNDQCLLVKSGSNQYKIELHLDVDGSLIEFPDVPKIKNGSETTINKSSINHVLKANKAALAETMEEPCLTGYYCESAVYTTDTVKISCLILDMFEEPILLPCECFELLSTVSQENIKVTRKNNEVLFETDDVIVYAVGLEDQDKFPVESIDEFINGEFPSWCSVKKEDMLSAIDRVGLFVEKEDKSIANIIFSEKSVTLQNKKGSASDVVEYVAGKEPKPFSATVDINFLKEMISSHLEDVVQIHYGNEVVIKFQQDEKLYQLIALNEEGNE